MSYRDSRFIKGVAAVVLFAATLSACGESRIPGASGSPGVGGFALPHGVAAPQRRAKHTTGDNLIYLTGAEVYVYPYPKGRLVGQSTGLDLKFSPECVDAAGNVFVISDNGGSEYTSVIYEFSHGDTSPVATLSDPGVGASCSYDATTGDLAVANAKDLNNPYGEADVAIYHDEGGTPTMVYSGLQTTFGSCAYDDSGNLYLLAGGLSLLRLASGSGTYEAISLNKTLSRAGDYNPQLQWDGKHMTVSSDREEQGDRESPISVYRLRITGAKAKVNGTTQLDAFGGKGIHVGQTWIAGTVLVGLMLRHGRPYYLIWPYPAGGSPHETVRVRRFIGIWGVVISATDSARFDTA